MEQNKFRTILFDVACAGMACDGHIDESEISALRNIEETSNYFKGINLSQRLSDFTVNFKENPNKTLETIVSEVKKTIFDPFQEMLILEILLRIIYADVKIHKKEIELVKNIRSNFRITDKTILDRFGKIEFLISEDYELKSTKKNNPIEDKSSDDLEDLYLGMDSEEE